MRNRERKIYFYLTARPEHINNEYPQVYWNGSRWSTDIRQAVAFSSIGSARIFLKGISVPENYNVFVMVRRYISLTNNLPQNNPTHTAKWDRCVRDVKDEAKELSEKKYHNPAHEFVVMVKNIQAGKRAYLTSDGDFSTKKHEARIYPDYIQARNVIRSLYAEGKHLKPGWQYAIVPATRKNPDNRAEKLYKQFHGEPARTVKTRKLKTFREGVEIGPVRAITYRAIRDGEVADYEHEFSQSASPLLIASEDGRNLALTGGCYQFTDRGIVDRKK